MSTKRAKQVLYGVCTVRCKVLCGQVYLITMPRKNVPTSAQCSCEYCA